MKNSKLTRWPLLLSMLTRDWSWEVMEDGTAMWSSPTAKRIPSANTPVSDLEQENCGTNFSGFGVDTISCRVGSLEVRGRGVPRMSAIWNNPIGKYICSTYCCVTRRKQRLESMESSATKRKATFDALEVVYEDADKTAQLVVSGEGGVWPHPFGRKERVCDHHHGHTLSSTGRPSTSRNPSAKEPTPDLDRQRGTGGKAL